MNGDLNTFLSSTPYIIPLLILLFWCSISFLIGLTSGWFGLSRRFPKHSDPYGEIRTAGPWFLTIYMRFWGHYSGIVRMTVASDALFLSVLFPFRIGHPPLQIPWSDIQLNHTSFFFRRYIELRLGSEEQIPFRISESAARKLGLLDRMEILPDTSPNFDTLSDSFVESMRKKPGE